MKLKSKLKVKIKTRIPENRVDLFYKVLFICGLLSLVCIVKYTEDLFIDWRALVFFIIGIGISITVLNLRNFKRDSKSFLWAFVVNCIGWGNLICLGLIFTNIHLSSSNYQEEYFPMKNMRKEGGHHSKQSRDRTLVDIVYKGRLKEIAIFDKTPQVTSKYKYLKIKIGKGVLGIDFIVDKNCLKPII